MNLLDLFILLKLLFLTTILLAETNISISLSNSTVFNPPESEFSKLDFNKADWANLRADISSLSSVDVYSSMNAIDVNVSKVIETIGHCCMLHVPLKSFKLSKVTLFHRERNILMRKRRKLMKKTIHDSKISETLTLWCLRAIQVDSPPPSAPTSGDLSRHNNS